jgi:UDP-3-O-[3-hydroxymyristoyl] glucosamine N-acyltransferase
MPSLAELAELVGGTFEGPSVDITGIASLEDAEPGDITFVTDEARLPLLEKSRAGAVLLASGRNPHGKPAIFVRVPPMALVVLLAHFEPEPPSAPEGVAPGASIHPNAVVGKHVRIGPGAVVESGASIGDGSEIGPLAHIGWDAKVGMYCRIAPLASIGSRCTLGDNVIVHSGAVIGADGFGFIPGPDGPKKVPQIGRVVVEDDVEIGANCTVDRATVGATFLRRRVKLDDQVHIAHNCDIGEGTLMAGQVGISGSVKVGKACVFGGQSGVADHVTLGDNVQVGAKSGVHRDAPAGEKLFGYPARPAREAIRLSGEVSRLPRLVERVRELEARIGELEKKSGGKT